AFSSGVCTSARVSDPMRRKFAGRLASVFSAVFTFTRGISSILRSMKTFTPTTPATTRGNATASATAQRPSRTRGNDGVIEQVIVPAQAEVPGSQRKTEARRHRPATLRQMPPGGAPTAAALLAALPESADAAVVRDQRYFVVAIEPDAVVVASGADALDGLDRLPPGGWAGFLAYELGGAVERVRPGRSTAGSQHEDRVPDLVLARFPTRVVLDPASGRYELHGRGRARDLLARAVESKGKRPSPPVATAPTRWCTSLDQAEFEQRVAKIREHIGAGDCYQVNLTRRLTTTRAIDPVGLFDALERANPSPHGAFVRVGAASGAPSTAVVSASPERFLSWRGPDIETRPIKGTGTDP